MPNIDRDLPPIDRVMIYMEHVERHRKQTIDAIKDGNMCAALAYVRDMNADGSSVRKVLTGMCYQQTREDFRERFAR